jgi:hypothetical protein
MVGRRRRKCVCRSPPGLHQHRRVFHGLPVCHGGGRAVRQNHQFQDPQDRIHRFGRRLQALLRRRGRRAPGHHQRLAAIKKSEYDKCQANGVKDIVEVKIGYDGIVVANSKKAGVLKLTRKDLFLALAKDVPGSQGGEKPWSPTLTRPGKMSILPCRLSRSKCWAAAHLRHARCLRRAGHGSRRQEFDLDQGHEKERQEKISRPPAQTVREDGAYVEAGENDNLIVQKLNANPDALGIFGFSFLDQNTDKIQGSMSTACSPPSTTLPTENTRCPVRCSST